MIADGGLVLTSMDDSLRIKIKTGGNKPMQQTTESDIKTRIEGDLKRHKILLYVKGTKEEPQCGFSHAVIDIFNKLNVPFETVDVLANPDIREGIKQLTNWPTIPQVFIKGEFIGGCDIIRDLYKNGELQTKVKRALEP